MTSVASRLPLVFIGRGSSTASTFTGVVGLMPALIGAHVVATTDNYSNDPTSRVAQTPPDA